MANSLALDMVSKGLVTNLIVLMVGYDVENLADDNEYDGEIAIDYYGRKVPKGVNKSVNLGEYTSSTKKVIKAATELYEKITDKKLLVRRINIGANTFDKETIERELSETVQLSFIEEGNDTVIEEKDDKVSKSVIKIQEKHGKNAILKGVSLQPSATQKKRNRQIGGHKA